MSVLVDFIESNLDSDDALTHLTHTLSPSTIITSLNSHVTSIDIYLSEIYYWLLKNPKSQT